MKKWWDGKYTRLGDSYSHQPKFWAGTTMLENAFGGGPTVINWSHTGTKYAEGNEALVKKVQEVLSLRWVHSITGDAYESEWFSSDDTLLVIFEDGKSVEVTTTNPKTLNEIKNFAKTFLPNNRIGDYYAVVIEDGAYRIRHVGEANKPLVRDNYGPKVVENFDKVVEHLNGPAKGRLVILTGSPGTGKTHFVQGIVNDVHKAYFVLLSASQVQEASGPQLLHAILDFLDYHDRKPFIIIVEDADDMLVARGADNMAAIQALLNLTDGILGQTLDVRVIATTNAKKLEMDKALLRPGRLVGQVIEVSELSVEQSNRVLQRLNPNAAPLTKAATLAEVYERAYRPSESSPDVSEPNPVDRLGRQS